MKNTLIIILALALSLAGQAQNIEFNSNELYPEGIAYSKKDKAFFVSSVHYGTIGKVDWKGNYTSFIESDELISSLGLQLDEKSNTLFVAIADPGVSVKTNASTQGKLAKLAAYDSKTGEQKFIVDLSAVNNGSNLANDLAIDKKGNIYVTNSFSPVIFRITKEGKASVFASNDAWGNEGINLNGIVYHPDGFLLAVTMNTGLLFKIDIEDPANITQVEVDAIEGGDGLILSKDKLSVISNSKQAVFQLTSSDNWNSAAIVTKENTQLTFPTTGVSVKGKQYILNAKLNEIFDANTQNTSDFIIQEVTFGGK